MDLPCQHGVEVSTFVTTRDSSGHGTLHQEEEKLHLIYLCIYVFIYFSSERKREPGEARTA